MNPYFDNFDDEKWLAAKVSYNNGATIEFYVEQVATWSPIRQARAEKHFELFELESLFSTQAGVELVNLRYQLEVLNAQGGPSLICDQLLEEAESRRKAFKNSWQTAMYEAIAADTYFHQQGFQQI